jgi:Zn-dependent peptidase ImmA (M78 family)
VIARLRLQQIQGLAREKLMVYGRMQLPVSPKDFAGQLDILVQPFVPAQSDVSGFLMQQGNSFMIGFSTAIRSEGFQNFTVAHELGHYFIDDHPLAILSSGKHLSRSGYISKDRYEKEADAFATELLMPWKLIEPIIRANAGGFGTIKAIADGCESSLLASAIRYTRVTEECVAVIVSRLGVVEFMTASTSFKQIPGIDWLRKRDSLPSEVPSKRFSTDLEWIRACHIAEEGGRLSAWFPGTRDREVEEDVVGLGSYERLLTVLMTEETESGDDDDDEGGQDDYIDRWKQGIFRGKR